MNLEKRMLMTRWLGACVLALAFLCLGGTRASAQIGASPCDSVSVAAIYKGNCCYDFRLTNTQSTYFLNSLQANMLGGSGVVTSATGPYATSSTSTTINWSFPNGIPASQGNLSGCFASTSGMLTIEFVWLSQGRIVCRDTLRLDCNIHPTDSCKVDTLRLNTGWNHLTNGVDPVGTYSTFWTVVADPSPNTNEPRPASHIIKYPVWAGPLPNSQWMSSYPSASNDTNGAYRFETCFCLKDGAGKVKFVCDLLADDMARVYVNGTQIGTTPAGWAFLNPPTHLDVDITQYVRPGKNCIQVEVVNTSNVAMGFDLAGYVTASSSLAFDKPHCCDPKGTIMGMKFWDRNCNGKRDPGEPGLPGWTISVTNGTNTYTTTTDALGNYYFTNLPPGAWTVSEIQQTGWQQTAPSFPGTYIVPLLAGQVISGRDFGNCRMPSLGKCFELAKDSIRCIQTPTGATAYQYTFDIRSLMSCNNGTQTATIGVLSPVSVTVAPSSFPVSNAWSTQSLVISGPGAVPGATVKLLVRVCCIIPGTPENCCYDTVEIRLPKCDEGCFEIVKDTVYCKEGPNGNTIYVWCFQVKNLSNCTATYFYLIPPTGVTMTPSTMIIGPLAPGATSGPFCVQITGPGAVPGPLMFNVRMCDRTQQCCCGGEWTIRLPECPKHDCCEGFIKRFGKLANSASWNGPASASGWMAAIGTGGAPIIRVEATLANISVNGAPAFGYFVNGTIANPFGATGGVVAPYGHELIWPTIPSGVNMSAPTNFNLNLRFPPMAPGLWKDVVRYCVRFRFTDKNCVTCDTVICFTRTRYRIIIIDTWTHGNIEKGDRLASAGSVVDGRLIGSDSGTFRMTFPEFPSEIGSGRFVGLDVTSPEATIIDATSNDAQFLVAEGVAYGTFEKSPGESVDVGIRYADRNGRNSIAHDMMLRYVLDSDPQDTLLESFTLTLRSDSIRGGDQVTETSVSVRKVRTYALHLRNANGSQEPIDRLTLTATNGARILAVGPAGNDSAVAIGFRRTDQGEGVASLNGESVSLPADESVNPIYITLSEVDGDQAVVRFTTINANGQTISEGEVTLGSPLSASIDGEDGDQVVAGAMLRGSYPNPTTGNATITFQLDHGAGEVTLVVSDAGGREVARPIDGESLGAGEHVAFVSGGALPSGVYYYTLRVGDRAETRSMQIVR